MRQNVLFFEMQIESVQAELAKIQKELTEMQAKHREKCIHNSEINQQIEKLRTEIIALKDQNKESVRKVLFIIMTFTMFILNLTIF